MKRGLTALAIGAALLLSTPAVAKEKSGRLGVGMDKALSTSSLVSTGTHSSESSSDGGLSVRFQATPFLGAQVILGYSRESYTQADADYSVSRTAIALRGTFQLLSSHDAAIGAVGGLAVLRTGSASGAVSSDLTHFALEGGVHAEWFVTDFLSLHTQVGLNINFIDGYSEVPGGEEKGGGKGLNLLNNADLIGNTGLTFWFP